MKFYEIINFIDDDDEIVKRAFFLSREKAIETLENWYIEDVYMCYFCTEEDKNEVETAIRGYQKNPEKYRSFFTTFRDCDMWSIEQFSNVTDSYCTRLIERETED